MNVIIDKLEKPTNDGKNGNFIEVREEQYIETKINNNNDFITPIFYIQFVASLRFTVGWQALVDFKVSNKT